jgi:hypothetical protein
MRAWRRYESKYFVDEVCAARIQAYCRRNLPMDPHSACRPDYQYPIYSVYLDSPARTCFYDARNRVERRVKLRVRTYRTPSDPIADYPHFFEVKWKRQGIVKKARSRLPADLGQELLWNGASPNDGIAGLTEAERQHLRSFLHLRSEFNARPTVAVFYTREAYETQTADRVRISLDRNLHAGLIGRIGSEHRDMWWPLDLEWAILEIKFTDSYPFWLADLIRSMEVSRRGVCKYVMCTRAATLQRPIPS